MARRARSLASIRVDPSDAAVRPRCRIKSAIAHVFHLAAVALAAAVVRGRSALHNFPKHVVQRPDELGRGSVVTLLKLGHFVLVAARAVMGGDDHCTLVTVMVKGRRIAVVCLVARIAVHTALSMSAALPLLNDSRR